MFGDLTHRKQALIVLTSIALLGPAFAGCVSGDGQEGSASFYVKDAPSDEFRHVNVTFSQVQVHRAAGDNASDNETEDGGWITVIDDQRTVDLLNFQDEGSRAFLGETNLTAATYTQIRVTVDEAYGIQKDDGSRVDITVSSGTVKVVRSFEITAGQETRVILDIDLDKSLRQQGNGQWRMTPVIGKTLVEENATGQNGDQPDGQGATDGNDGATGNETGNESSNEAGEASGGPTVMTAYVKDAPTDEFDEIWLTLDSVRVHFAGNGSDGNDTDEGDETAENGTSENEAAENETAEDDRSWITVFDGTRSVNLLNFSEDGARAFLGEAEVEPGRYTQVRLNVTEAWGIQDGNRTNITLSSGEAKITRPFVVPGNGSVAQLVIDVDLDRSLHPQGPNGWRMSPVIGSVALDHVKNDARQDRPDHAAQGQGGEQAGGQGQGNGQGNGQNASASSQQMGEATAYVKDRPTHNFSEVWLTFDLVEVHLANASNDTDENGTDSWLVLFNGTRSVNLLNFSEEGAKAFLGNASLPVGTYTQVRLNITEAWGVDNATGDNVTLQVPSGSAKITQPFTVEANNTTQIVIDVDLDKSLHRQGGGPAGEATWRLTPVIGRVLIDHVEADPQADLPDQAS